MRQLSRTMLAAMAAALSSGTLAWALIPPQPQPTPIFQAQDADGNGKVTVTEYQAYVSTYFQDKDADKNGKVDPAETLAASDKAAKAMDFNSDSFVTVDEYVSFFCGAAKAQPQAKPARAGAKKDSFRQADLDQDGQITSVECVAAKTTLFKLIDKNKDGKLSQQELADNARAEFRKADANKDGFVTLTEWVAFTVEPEAPAKKAEPPAAAAKKKTDS